MFEKVCRKRLCSIIVMLWSMLVLSLPVEAKSPIIIRHDAHLMEKDVKINLAWLSDEPIVKIIVSAGREQLIIQKNIDNDRTESGYSGEIDIVVPAYMYGAAAERSMYMSRQSSSEIQQNSMEMYANSASPRNESVQYTVQLIDEVNQRSALLKDTLRRNEPTLPRTGQKQQPIAAVNILAIDTKNPLNSAINTTIGLLGKIGQTPDIKNVDIKFLGDNRVIFSFEATGSKGIDRIVYEVRNSSGDIDNQNTISCNSEKQCSRQSESLNMGSGSYLLYVTATDIENSSSKKVEKGFQVTAGSAAIQTQQTTQQQVTQQETPQSTSTSSSQNIDPGVVYEKE